MADAMVVNSEDDLWQLLALLLARGRGPYIGEKLFHIIGWRPELLYFPDEPLGHTISPSIARAVSGFHNSLSKAYAYIAYGEASARRLRAEDQDVLDLTIMVVAGSNGLEIAEHALDRLAKGVIAKMTGKQLTIGVVLFLLLYFSSTVGTHWIDQEYEAKKRERESRERVELSEQETQRISLIARALEANPGLKPLSNLSEESKDTLVRSVTQVPRARVLGATLTGDEAKVIVSRARERGRGKRLDGQYEVVEIDVENPDGYMGRLRSVATKEEFTVNINRSELTEEDIQVLFVSLQEKRPIDALVNAYFIGDKIVHATIVRANDVPPEDGP